VRLTMWLMSDLKAAAYIAVVAFMVAMAAM